MKSNTNYLIILGIMVVMILVAVPSLFAQAPPPPALPGLPDQAPLGGLGLLAAAGGAYAWKKLRSGNQD